MIACPACDAPIANEQIRPGRALAVCAVCDATVRLESGPEGWEVVGHSAAAAPEGLVVEIDEPPRRETAGYRDALTEHGRLLVTRRWWTPAVLFLTFFAIAWDSFLIFWYSRAFRGPGMGGAGVIFLLFPLLHVAVGVGLTWWVLATWLNRTVIEVREGELRCTHGPVPWPFGRPQPIALETVELFETEQAKAKLNGGRNPAGRTWRILARTRGGAKIPVVTHLADAEQAGYLARRLEQQLP